jgi:hypothetical protein
MGHVTGRLFLGLMLLCLACTSANAGGVSERSGHVNDVGLMTLANQTQLFTSPEFSFYVSPQFQWGVTKDLELLAIVGANFGSKVETDPGLLALRYELMDGLALGLGGTFPIQDDGTLFGIYPALYATFNLAEELTLTMNVAFNLTAKDVDRSWIWHTSVIEWVFHSAWSTYLEVDWVIPIEKAVADSSLNLFAGAQYNINTTHALNLFVMMPLMPSVAPDKLSLGLTWALAWNL